MTRAIYLYVVLVLLLQPCTLAVGQYQQGSVHWTNWATMPGGPPFSFKPRSAEQGPPNQHQGIVGGQAAYAIGGQSGTFQITKAAGEQFQNVTDTEILQHQNGSMIVGQIAGVTGAGHTGGIQHFDAHQHQAASSAAGQSIQNTFIGITQFSHVAGAPGSEAIAGGKVVVSTSQTTYVN